MSYLGKEYKVVKQENFEAFLNTTGFPPDQIAKYLEHKSTSKLVKNGDSYTHISSHPDGIRETHFKDGVEYEEKLQDKYPVKGKYVIDGNKVTQTVTVDGVGTATFVREYNGDELVVTITSSKFDGVAKRWYKA